VQRFVVSRGGGGRGNKEKRMKLDRIHFLSLLLVRKGGGEKKKGGSSVPRSIGGRKERQREGEERPAEAWKSKLLLPVSFRGRRNHKGTSGGIDRALVTWKGKKKEGAENCLPRCPFFRFTANRRESRGKTPGEKAPATASL